MPSEDDLPGLIRKHHGDEIDANQALLDLAASELGAWSGRAVKRGADRIILAEAARATKSLGAVIVLCESGFGEQSMMLNRSLFEGMAVAHWTSESRREAVGLFGRHHKFTALLWWETLDALGWLDDGDKKPSIGARQQYVKLFGPYGTKPWVGRNLPTLLGEIEHLWSEDDRRHLWAFHNVAHRYSNQVLHSSTTALGATRTGQTATELHLTVGPSNQFISQSLLSSLWIYAQVFSLLIDVFRLQCRAEFNDVFATGWQVFSDRPASP